MPAARWERRKDAQTLWIAGYYPRVSLGMDTAIRASSCKLCNETIKPKSRRLFLLVSHPRIHKPKSGASYTESCQYFHISCYQAQTTEIRRPTTCEECGQRRKTLSAGVLAMDEQGRRNYFWRLICKGCLDKYGLCHNCSWRAPHWYLSKVIDGPTPQPGVGPISQRRLAPGTVVCRDCASSWGALTEYNRNELGQLLDRAQLHIMDGGLELDGPALEPIDLHEQRVVAEPEFAASF